MGTLRSCPHCNIHQEPIHGTMDAMVQIMTGFVLLIGLFLLAQSFAQTLFAFWFLITKSQSWAIRLTSFLLLPGTFIHEISHWVVAEILQVRTGKMSLWPEYIEGEGLKMGSVQIASADAFRRTLIGIAPLVIGVALLSLLTPLLPNPLEKPLQITHVGVVLVTFLISNTMFSSKKDLEAALGPLIFLLLMIFSWWFFAWPIPKQLLQETHTLIIKLNTVFLLTLGVNLSFFLLVKLLSRFFEQLLRRRVVRK